MKAITLWQPWASLLACGAKQYETRSWPTNYRGLIAIHASKKRAETTFRELEMDIYNCPEIFAAIRHCCRCSCAELPHGGIIATAELVNCWRIVHHPGSDVDRAKHIPVGAELDVPKHHPDFHRIIVPSEQEMLFGDWTPERYAWEFTNMKMLEVPIAAKGRQGLWNWDPSKASSNGE